MKSGSPYDQTVNTCREKGEQVGKKSRERIVYRMLKRREKQIYIFGEEDCSLKSQDYT